MLQFTRTDPLDDATETLTVCRFTHGALKGELCIQAVAGTPEENGDFVGLFTLDGDLISLGEYAWDFAEDDTIDLDDLMEEWSNDYYSYAKVPQ